MDVELHDPQEIFEGTGQFAVPLYQRRYCWNREEHWKPLWEDLVAVVDSVDSDASTPHFLGAIVVHLQLESTATASLQVRNIVDGQQRLATLQVLMAALRCVAVEAEAQDSQYHIERLLVNDQRRYNDYDRLKVLPTTGDRDVFQEIVIKAVDYEPGNQYTHAVKGANRNSKGFVGAFNFYREISRQFCTGDDGSLVPERVDRLVHAVSRGLSVTVIDLKSGDDPQAIFECLNARGAPLRAMDLLKNHLLGGISSENGALSVDEAYKKWWEQFDADEFWEKKERNRTRGDAFLYHWLVSFAEDEPRQRSLYRDFRRETRGRKKSEIMQEAHVASNRYLRLYQDNQGEIGRALRRWRVSKLSNTSPLLLRLLALSDMTDESDIFLIKALHVLESWTIRRRITSQPTSSYNLVIRPMLQRLKNTGIENAAEVIVEGLEKAGDGLAYWPTDEEIKGTVVKQDMKKKRFSQAWQRELLTAIEDHLRGPQYDGGPCPLGLEREHIMPESWAAHWPSDNPNEDRDMLVQTLGNLTLTSHSLNSSLSNLPWKSELDDQGTIAQDTRNKRDILREHSGLKLNAELVELDDWDEDAIRQRSERLAGYICDIWPVYRSEPRLVAAPADISPTATGQHNMSELKPGTAVCFTGTSVINGRKIERAELERLAAGIGLVAVPSVTKKKCCLLVASDVNSRSGKADKARKWSIPIISTQEFLRRAQSNS